MFVGEGGVGALHWQRCGVGRCVGREGPEKTD